MMDIRYLNYILTLAETGNMTKAAQRLYISQPTLSHFLSKYEAELGVNLFDHSRKAYTLTPAGEIYVKYAKEIISLTDRMEQELKDFGKNIQLNLGTSSNLDLDMLAATLTALNEVYPNTVFSTESGATRLVENKVAKGELDMAFVPVSNTGCKNPLCQYIDLKAEEVLFVVSEKHPFCRNLPADTIHRLDRDRFVEVFDRTPFILHQTDSCISEVENRLFHDFSINPVIFSHTSLSPAIIDMVSQNVGTGFIPCSAVRADKAVIYFSLQPPLYHTHSIIFRKDLMLIPPLKHLITLAREYAEKNWEYINLPQGYKRN